MLTGHSSFGVSFGGYPVFLGLNYVPLFAYAITISRRKSARKEVAEELAHTDLYMRRYGVQQALLLVPSAIPVLAVVQEAEKHTAERFPSG